MYRLSLIFIFGSLPLYTNAQNFFNFDLEGEVTQISDLPYGWEAIEPSDQACLAINVGNATADLCDIDGLNNPISCIGNPYSGNTFVSGLLAGTGPGIYHEGIQQSVSGFEIDTTYTIYFYQANVKQTNVANDSSGSWAVYIDDVLIDISNPSINSLPPNSLELNWELRQVTFTATSTSHLIKFLPSDDDSDTSTPNNGIRMGIDHIYINQPPAFNIDEELIMPNVFSPNGDGVNDIFAPFQLGAINSMKTTIVNRWGVVVYESTDIYIQWDGKSPYEDDFPEGTYFWMVSGESIDYQKFTASGFVELVR